MEDGGKEAPCKEPKFLGKAGWVKKAPGRLLASYKDRYIHVEKTEVVVYENDDLQNCLERLDLENYDKCHELKSPFKRKHRLILIRAPKAGNKVSDFKFQAQTAEERDSWIKALSDCICRAKNKVLDEVKIDESCNLEHVTRTRPKANRNRRPPTRIHLKEVADVSSDGIIRLDLDLEDAFMPNGTHHASVDGAVKEANKDQMPPSSNSEAAEKPPGPDAEEKKEQKEIVLTEPEVSPQKKAIKPPMPPTKEAKPSVVPGSEAEKDDVPEKRVLKPPMAPSKEAKPTTTKAETGKMTEKSPDVSKKTAPPPTPPKKSGSVSDLAEASQQTPHPPTPPCKEKKPSHLAVEPDHKVQDTANESEEEDDDNSEATDQPISEKTSHSVGEDEAEDANAEGQDSEKESKKSTSSDISGASQSELVIDVVRNSPSPLLTPKNMPEKPAHPDMQDAEGNITQPQVGQDHPTLLQKASNTSSSSPEEQEAAPEHDIPSVVISLNDPISIGLSLSPLPGEKKNRGEEKSIDSGQHSDDDSEGSESGDTRAASTAALRGSHPGLVVLDTNEDIVQINASVKPRQATSKPQVPSKVFPQRHLVSNLPLKPTAKARSASSGDLLSGSSAQLQVTQPPRAVSGNYQSPGDDVRKLEVEVALEMEKTIELLNSVSGSQGGGDGQGRSEDLLAKAMEKLRKADHVLREVQKLTPLKNTSNRKSW